MNRRWLFLALGVLAGALAFTLAGRLPRRAPAPEAPAPPTPLDAATLVIEGGAATPAVTPGVLGHRLAVTVVNRGGTPARVALSGYEHAYAAQVLAPGESRTDTLLLDLPGEDFAWMVDGRPSAQLRVAGSHLGEGRH